MSSYRRFFRQTLLPSVVVLTVMGCRPAPPADTEPELKPKQDSTVVMRDAGPRAVDLGDVEANVRIEMTVAEESRTGQIAVTDETSARGTLTMSTANVSPPGPEQLWLQIRIVPGATFEYDKRPIAVRGTILRDNQPLDTFSTLLGKHINARGTILAGEVPPLEFRINVMENLSSPPQSMLVHAQAEMQLLPENAGESAPFPAADAQNTTTILSNPVRINFSGAEHGV